MGTGGRLKAERNRLGRTVEEFAQACGIGRTAQFNYEADKRSPDSEYLAAAASAGVDVLYVVTGRHSAADKVEQLLLDRYRGASPEIRQAALAVLGVVSLGGADKPTFVGASGDNHGQIVQGSIQQDHVEIHVGPKKRGLKKASSK